MIWYSIQFRQFCSAIPSVSVTILSSDKLRSRLGGKYNVPIMWCTLTWLTETDNVQLQMVSGVCKVSAGRLRPHFMSVCQPDTSCGSLERPEYIKNFTCLGNTILFPDTADMEHSLREARLSFLSGHASLSWFGMVFSAGYLHLSATNRERNIATLPLLLVQVRRRQYKSCQVQSPSVSIQSRVRQPEQRQ